MSEELKIAAEMISQADSILVTAGAGMGADSGLPTFRGNDGLWKAYPALGEVNFDFQSIACPNAFYSNPQLAWGFYGHRLSLYRATQPHAGFGLLSKWAKQKPNSVAVFTSNVDGQFQKAGFSPTLIDECHGSIHYLQCMKPCRTAIWPADDFVPLIDEKQCLLLNELPVCPYCGGIARPNIMMFGDNEWVENREVEQSQRLESWLDSISKPVIIEIGAGVEIPSVRIFSRRVTKRFDAFLIRINLDEQSGIPCSESELTFHSSSISVLSDLDRLMNKHF